MKKITILLTLILFTFSHSFSQEKLDFENFSSKADAYMKAIHHVGEFSGVVLFAHKNEILFHKGYGLASKRFNQPNNVNTKFRVGSITKSFTAIAILQLVEKGLLSLKDPVSKFIKDYPFGDTIRIENLLSHTSGIKRDIKFEDENKKYSLKALVKMSEVDSLLYQPGEKMSYSNCGYILLQAILEDITKQSYRLYITQHVLKPLGLKNTGIEDPFFPPVHFADGYKSGTDYNGNFGLRETQMQSHGYSDGVGALFSTTEDLMLFCKQIGKSSILKPETWDLALSPFIKEPSNGYKWGLGFNIIQGKKYKVINHNGRTEGFRGGYFQFLNKDITCVILANNSDAARETIVRTFQAILNNKTYYIPEIHEPVSVKNEILNHYSGEYKTKDFPFEIIKFENKIFVKSHGDSPVELIPYKDNAFFCKYFDLILEFIRDNNKTIGANWIYKGQSQEAKKI